MDKSTLELLELFNTHSSLSLTQLSAILNIDYFDISNPVHYLMDQKYIQKNNAALLEKLEGNILSQAPHWKSHTPDVLQSMNAKRKTDAINTLSCELG